MMDEKKNVYSLERSNGYATHIWENDKVILVLNPGATRNEENIDRIMVLLNSLN